MTVAANNRTDAVGNGSVSTYAFTYKIFLNTDLRVTVLNTASPPVETRLVLTTDYTVTGVGLDAGGTITLVNSGQSWLAGGFLKTGYQITIRRVRPLTQSTSIRNQGPYYPNIHEDVFDHGVMLSQQLMDEISRSARLAESILPATFDPTLPTDIGSVAGRTLAVNDTRNGFKMGASTDDISNAQGYASSASASATSAATSAAAAAHAIATIAWRDVVFKTFADSPITIANTDEGKLFSIDTTGGNVVVNLPQINALDLTGPWSVGLRRSDSSGNTITINRGGSSDLIDGGTSKVISASTTGATLVPDTDPSPDQWTSIDYGLGTNGVLPVISGGTNSNTSLNNNRVMKSSGGKIVEAAAITGNKALASDANGIPVASTTSDAELLFLIGVTSAIQTQLNNKQATLGNNSVSNTLLAQMPANTVKANNTGSTANASDVALASAPTASAVMIRDTNANAQINNILEGFTTTATAAGTTTLTVGSTYAQQFTGATTQTVVLPAANTLVLGQSFSVMNRSTGIVTVNANGGGLVQSMNPGTQCIFTVTNIGSGAGAWDAAYSSTSTSSSSGSSGINFLSSNPDAETNTAPWATYSGSAANTPGTGTGGTATGLTFSRSTSSPLRGIGSFLLVQTNSTNIQGKGASCDFSTDSADQASIQNISFDYNASSTFVASNGTTAPLNDGTTTTNAGNSDIEVFIYDKTNSVLIPVSPQVITANGSNNFKFSGTFQTAYNSTSYRFILHVATANANATGWTFKFDNVKIGPQVLTNAGVVGDWKNDLTFTTAGFGTLAASDFRYKRIGDTMLVSGFMTFGTTSATTAAVIMPSGITIDTSKLTSTANSQRKGLWRYLLSAAGPTNTGAQNGDIFYDGSTSDRLFFTDSMGSNAYIKENGNAFSGSGNTVTFEFSVPILGWASTVQMSQETDTRVVAAAAYLSSNSTVTGVIPFDTKIYDTHGAFNTSTGLFTVPVSGYYRLSGYGVCSGSPGMQAFKNGSAYAIFGFINGANGGGYAGTVQAVAGDTLGVGNSGSVTWDGGALSNAAANIFIERVSGPAAIAATETVSCRYHASSTTITSSLADITYSSKDFDTHGAVSGATWKCPVAGKYHVSASLSVTAATVAAGNAGVLQLNKNGSQYSNDQLVAGAATTKPLILKINDYVQCVPGDTLAIQASMAGTTPSITSSNFYNFFGVTRVGN